MPERDRLLQQVLAAECATELEELVSANLDQVLEVCPGWTTVPAPIRGDSQAVNRYANRVFQVARLLNAKGHHELLRTIEGDRDSNPVYRWREAMARSEALADAGRYADSAEILSSLLAELDQLSGSGVEEMRPKVFGALGVVWLQAGDLAQAVHWTQQALRACLANEDSNGIATYRENLQAMEAVYLPAADPEAGARLLECRRLIASAQAASDHFDYAESNQILDQALAIMQEGDGHLRSSFAGKIYGLRGWNHYNLGNRSAAQANTQRALTECRAAADPDGVRIYTANVQYLSS